MCVPYEFFRYVFVINMFYCIDLQFAFFFKKEYLLKKVKINILFSAPLKYTHYGEIYKNVDMRGEIGLLSRNILFDSEDADGSDTYGGNLKVSALDVVDCLLHD